MLIEPPVQRSRPAFVVRIKFNGAAIAGFLGVNFFVVVCADGGGAYMADSIFRGVGGVTLLNCWISEGAVRPLYISVSGRLSRHCLLV